MTTTVPRDRVDQRERILGAALTLMAEHGARGMSMRRLAAACDLNVATLYHYFPSKQDLYRAAIEHGRYEALLSRPLPTGGDPRARLAALLDALATEMLETEELWRVLLAECLHGDEAVLEPVLGMSAAFEQALASWLGDLLPELPALREPAVLHTLRHALYGLLVEYLPQPAGRAAAVTARTGELAAVFTRLAARPATRPIAPAHHEERQRG